MMNIEDKKKKIISFLENVGPSLPVRIAKAIEMDPVFASAIVSELLGTKQVRTSHMKVGSSPLYLLPGQEKRLEEHAEHLKSVEKEAYLKLKEKGTIVDENETPAIRVALRNIKDFAIPFKSEEKIMWKYAFASEKKKEQKEVPKVWEAKKEEIKKVKEESKKIENIFKEKKSPTKETFLEQVEEFLGKKNTKIISMEEVDKKKVIAKTKSENETALLFAFNKKRITEDELMKCYKKAKASSLPYHIIISGELTKKMNDTMDAYKKLLKVEKLNDKQPQSL